MITLLKSLITLARQVLILPFTLAAKLYSIRKALFRLALQASKCLATLLTLHFLASAVNISESFTSEQYALAYSRTAAYFAERQGYVLPSSPDNRELDCLEFATTEAIRNKINPAIAHALIRVESNNRQEAISSKGALGLMQILPSNAPACQTTPEALARDCRVNVKCGNYLLGRWYKQEQDMHRALQGYNAGNDCIGRCKDPILYATKIINMASTDIHS